ncbi:ATP-binding protein [Desulfonema ishimotonii]|uniref:ATP-binding protein n=1 Tax=Desulfonema ishimotonii TaxID=45657 RepID=A0A401G1A2_9BACT|nr:ATP-binding cassette domain-containing protein [Desulfonema ishimotonii]GBC62991.1 ATP-binding protein [Desulfonema ishimotonii]
MDGLHLEDLRFKDIGPVNLRIGRGECVGISGPSGAGKTLLLRAIADMDPHTGNVFLDGTESRDMTAPEWRKKVGLLPAESAWWADTVGAHFRSVSEVWFRRLGFEADVLSWEISRLSGGERQRLALLRLLTNRPEALLLDEPTANLDPESVMRVEELIGEYRRTCMAPVLWVSHDPRQLQRVASRRFLIRDRRLSAA